METTTLPINTLLQGGKYKIVSFISSGGFGCTYEAEHTLLQKRVAIKEFFVRDFCNRDAVTAHVSVGTTSKKALVDKLRRKFIDEARALSHLEHKGIVKVSDVFEENGTAYYVMDYIEGKSLGKMLRDSGALSEQSALGYIRQVADALKYVHSNNRLHLDIKPDNIMVDGNGNAILIDFGASKQYDEESGENTSTLMGRTPGYAPLEQMGNDVVKFMPATDIYALGATLYKLLTGNTPLSATLLASGYELTPLPNTVSEKVRKAVTAAMQSKRAERPQSIDEFLEILDGVNEITILGNEKKNLPETEITPSTKSLKKKLTPKKKSIKGILIATVSLIIVACATFFIINHYTKQPQPEDFNSYLKEAEKGDAEIQYKLAMCYYDGDGVKQDYEKAVDWFEKSANQGYAEAQRMLGVCYINGYVEFGDSINSYDEKAVELFKKAAEQGNSEAKADLARAYHNGEGVKENDLIAAWWARQGAEEGNAYAQRILGIFYYEGDGISKDYVEAVKWLKKSAEQGDAWAQYLLGLCYENGQGLAKDKTKAKEFYKMAADQGNEKAIEALSDFRRWGNK